MSEPAKTVYGIESKVGVRRALLKLSTLHSFACPSFACATEYLTSSKPDAGACAVDSTWEETT